MNPSLPALIFDLDGTLTDSKPGIVGCLGEVLAERGIAAGGSLDRFVGPPVEEWTAELLPHGDEAARAELVAAYRACYDRSGWKNNSVYPGVREMLEELRRRGHPLYVCTSKPQHFAVRILELFALDGYFKAIYGDRAEYASHSKVELLARLLRAEGLRAGRVWMIGDRVYDFRAAAGNGVRSLAAGWGYGPAAELAEADSVAVVPAEVPEMVAETGLRSGSPWSGVRG